MTDDVDLIKPNVAHFTCINRFLMNESRYIFCFGLFSFFFLSTDLLYCSLPENSYGSGEWEWTRGAEKDRDGKTEKARDIGTCVVRKIRQRSHSTPTQHRQLHSKRNCEHVHFDTRRFPLIFGFRPI